MKALVLDPNRKLSIRDMDVYSLLGPDDVRIRMKKVGICGSDIHYYSHGKIGPYVVNEPMILGHEGAGEIIEVGSNVRNIHNGDRVCIEPGIPNWLGKAARKGLYNLDPDLTFWATPPGHGCLCEEVVHPANLVYKLPEAVSYEEGAMVEPLAIGMQAAVKAEITPGDTALVYGAGTIGIMTMLSALAGGCSTVVVADIKQQKLDLIKDIPGCIPCNTMEENLGDLIHNLTDGWGANIVFEASGSQAVAQELFTHGCPGGHVVYIGMPVNRVSLDIVAAQAKEIRIDTIFRYANVFDRAVSLIAGGKIDVTPYITDMYAFSHSIEAFEYAESPGPSSVKVMIDMET
jgi:D-xylulose reductase